MWYLRQVICIICMQSLRFRTFLPSTELYTAVQYIVRLCWVPAAGAVTAHVPAEDWALASEVRP